MHSGLNSSRYSIISFALLAVTAAGAIYMAISGQWWAALALTSIVGLALIFVSQRKRLPAIFTLLFVTAGVINAAGYIFSLWKTPVWFDEAVHFYTSFTVAAAIGWLLLSRTSANAAGHPVRFTAAVAGLGLVLGIAWEIFEWIIGIIGTRQDTIMDLIMDTLGAIAAGMFCAWAAKTEQGRSGHDGSTGEFGQVAHGAGGLAATMRDAPGR